MYGFLSAGTRSVAKLGSAALAVTLAVALGASACGSSSAGGGSSGGVLKIGDAGSRIDSLNPLVGVNGFATLTFRVVYPYLLQYNSRGQIVGDFAKSYSVSPDGKEITFTTYPNAHWIDGKPLTASDAAWSINTIVKFASGPTAKLASNASGVISATATSPTSLVVRYQAAAATSLDGIANLPVLPEHIWAPLAVGNGSKLTTYPNTSLIGAGPFKVTNYVPNQFELFSRNPSYYGPKPNLSGLGFEFYTSNDALISALRTGAVDAIYEVPATTVSSLRADKSLAVNDVPGLDTVELMINASPYSTTHPELRQLAVRQAIDLAISKENLVSVVGVGSGSVSGTVVPPGLTQWHDSSIPALAANAAEANRMLDSLGYRRGPGGIRIVGGHPMSYTLIYPSVSTGVPSVITEVVNDLTAIGIQVNPRESDFPSWSSASFAPHNRYENWDLNLVDFSVGFDPGPYLDFWTCAQVGIDNFVDYCSKRYDTLYAEQSREFGQARVATVDEAQAVLARSFSVISLYVANAISASGRIGNLPSTTATPLIVNYESKLWLEQTKL